MDQTLAMQGVGTALTVVLGVASKDVPVRPAMPSIPSLTITVTLTPQQQQNYMALYKSMRMDSSCSRWNPAIQKASTLLPLFSNLPSKKNEFNKFIQQMKINQQYSYFPTVNTLGCKPPKTYDGQNSNQTYPGTDWYDYWHQLEQQNRQQR